MKPMRQLSNIFIAATILTLSGTSLAGSVPGMSGMQYTVTPYPGMFGSMGGVYSPYYSHQFQQPGMGSMSGMNRAGGMYSGMYGSMGGVYSPYYSRQFQQPGGGMSGMHRTGGMSGMSSVSGMGGMQYTVNPYSDMYGSMGGVYSPYYSRQFQQPGMMDGMSGMNNAGGMSSMSGMNQINSPNYGSGMSGMSNMASMNGMDRMSGYFRITPDGQIFFYPHSGMGGMSGG